MARININHIIGKNKAFNAVINELIQNLGANIWIEDDRKRILVGQPFKNPAKTIPFQFEGEDLGCIKGNGSIELIADLMVQLIQKESEKKKLGSEVLNLYQEINVIFNFSEQLSQTIEPDIIASLALDQGLHAIGADSGTVVLWSEENKDLHVPSISGEELFIREKIVANPRFLLEIGLSGQSEILADLSKLKEKGILTEDSHSLMYAAMKVNQRIMGAIILASKKPEAYTAANLKLLVTLALQSSSAIESAMLYEKNIREAREREEAMMKIHEVTKKFVPHEFIRSLGRENLIDVRLGDQAEKIVTVLFTDIRDFTSLSELMTPEENFRFVSSFNERLGPVIRSNNGFINQYLGDSIMAIFPEDPNDALHAAIEMQQAIWELSQERKIKNLKPIRAGIGMHTGPLIMGITGDEHRMDAATISDTVNTASRIESLTKYYNSPLLLSNETLIHIKNKNQFHFRNLGSVRLKGKHKALNIIECFDGYQQEEFDKKIQTLSLFNEAMSSYFDRQFKLSSRALESILSTDPSDLTARYFMENSIRYLKQGVPENWLGIEEMINK